MKNTISTIAEMKLGIDTLESRNSDRLDFHELSVCQIKAALEAAWQAGHARGIAQTEKLLTIWNQ